MLRLQILLLFFLPCHLTAASLTYKMQTFYKKNNTFEAFFEQNFLDINFNKTAKGIGKIFYKKAGKIRLEYLHPSKNSFILNERNFYFLDSEENNIYFANRCLSADILDLIFLSFSDLSSLKKKFNITENYSEQKLVLVPKKSNDYYSNLTLILDKKLYFIRQLEIIDNFGNSNIFTMKSILFNKKIPNKFFQMQSFEGINYKSFLEDCS